MLPSAKLAPTSSAVALAPPSGQNRILDHLQVWNPNSVVIYLRILEDGAELVNDAIGPGFSGPVVYDLPPDRGALTLTASTADNGTGDPTLQVEATPRWARSSR